MFNIESHLGWFGSLVAQLQARGREERWQIREELTEAPVWKIFSLQKNSFQVLSSRRILGQKLVKYPGTHPGPIPVSQGLCSDGVAPLRDRSGTTKSRSGLETPLGCTSCGTTSLVTSNTLLDAWGLREEETRLIAQVLWRTCVWCCYFTTVWRCFLFFLRSLEFVCFVFITFLPPKESIWNEPKEC